MILVEYVGARTAPLAFWVRARPVLGRQATKTAGLHTLRMLQHHCLCVCLLFVFGCAERKRAALARHQATVCKGFQKLGIAPQCLLTHGYL